MSITRLQQARQMYAMGQRVAKTMDGSRPGYRGSDWGDQAKGTGAYSGGTTGGANFNAGNTGGPADDRSSNLQTYNHNIATGQADKNPIGPIQLNEREKVLQNFYNTRPDVPNIPLGPFSFITNFLNPGGVSPLQKFADFTASKNRPFFENVIRGGKIPGLNFGTVSNMTPEQLEASYKSYMDNRMSGATDAYGNPHPTYGKDQGDYSGIFSLADYDVFDDTEENANDPFVSRFLQNQPDDIREGIEAGMQNYYTV